MKKLILIIASVILSLVFLFAFEKRVAASEGEFELESTTRDSFRCYAFSNFLENRKYRVGISCRNLLYPPEEELFSYILWANSAADNKPIKLGSLGVGKASFDTGKAFNQLYVTIEKDKGVRQPTGTVVMRGNLQRIEFLESAQTPTPMEEVSEGEEVAEEMPEEEEQPLSTRDKLLTGLRRAGLIAFFALVALVGLIFVVSRSRG